MRVLKIIKVVKKFKIMGKDLSGSAEFLEDGEASKRGGIFTGE